MLTAYFDESGTHAGAPDLTVAGYVAGDDQWERFNAEWSAAMDDFDIPAFHMTQFEARRGAFRHWPESKRVPRLRRLLGIVNRHARANFAFSAMWSAYRDNLLPASYKGLPLTTQNGGLYTLTAMACVGGVLRWAARNAVSDQIQLVFEKGAVGAGMLAEMYRDQVFAHDELRERFASLEFEPKASCQPLQAADILAYESYRQVPRAHGSEKREPRHPILRELIKVRQHDNDWVFADEAGFAELAARVDRRLPGTAD
jgi:hypothetical protein